MTYQVVSAQSSDVNEAIKELEKKVKELCLNGWIPHGGISVVTKNYDLYFAFQAMTHYSLG